MSLTEFYELIDQARQDADAGRLVSHEELAEKVKGCYLSE
jgi:predicted transcriptional regulator